MNGGLSDGDYNGLVSAFNCAWDMFNTDISILGFSVSPFAICMSIFVLGLICSLVKHYAR